ncbi:Ectonucleoside triphosphate diphosphohydrolase 1 [Hypsibius exemplaris]|uniref:Ectonucleoside triphosphate diphosphohydrolase 1 n=1 Tax=Hypsibius exemplaris TaxID=2072580 RepID=A0A1W0X2H5_HYPEX|nr:Ectonucleoside triphosphate diphosphohydrolase 1 [Hypsibius exemplaris]
MAGGRGKLGSPVEGQKLVKTANGDAEDDADEWHVAYNKPAANGAAENGERKRHSSNISTAQKSVQSRIEDLELDDAGFVDQQPRFRGGTNRKAFFAIILGVAAGVAAVVCVVVFYFRSSYIPNNYIIVVDAGSSHTKLNVFHYRGDKINGTGKIEQVEFRECNGTLQSFVGKDVSKLRLAWESCLLFAKDQIPEDRWEKTEVYVGGTSGLRQLRKTTPAVAEQLLETVRILLNTTYRLAPDHTHVMILNGEEEGALAWATVNFITKGLLPDNITAIDRSHDSTFGSLDLGGSSTQIAFAAEEVPTASPNFKLTFFGRSYQLYSKSFECRGKSEAHRLLRARLIVNHMKSQQQSSKKVPTIEHPCYPAGLVFAENHTTVFGSYCTRYLTTTAATASFPQRMEYQFRGTGNVTQCQREVRSLFDETKCPIGDRDCSFRSKLKSMNITGPFMGFAGMFYVMQFFNLTHDEDHVATKLTIKPQNFRDAYRRHCTLAWPELSMMYAKSTYEPFLMNYCFDGIFIDTLLYDVYGFSDEEFERIQFRSTVNGVSAGWAVGLALNSTNAIPPENELERMSKAFFLIFLVIFATSSLQEDVSQASSLQEDVSQTSPLQEDVSQTSTLQGDVSQTSSLQGDVSQTSSLQGDVSQAVGSSALSLQGGDSGGGASFVLLCF